MTLLDIAITILGVSMICFILMWDVSFVLLYLLWIRQWRRHAHLGIDYRMGPVPFVPFVVITGGGWMIVSAGGILSAISLLHMSNNEPFEVSQRLLLNGFVLVCIGAGIEFAWVIYYLRRGHRP